MTDISSLVSSHDKSFLKLEGLIRTLKRNKTSGLGINPTLNKEFWDKLNPQEKILAPIVANYLSYIWITLDLIIEGEEVENQLKILVDLEKDLSIIKDNPADYPNILLHFNKREGYPQWEGLNYSSYLKKINETTTKDLPLTDEEKNILEEISRGYNFFRKLKDGYTWPTKGIGKLIAAKTKFGKLDLKSVPQISERVEEFHEVLRVLINYAYALDINQKEVERLTKELENEGRSEKSSSSLKIIELGELEEEIKKHDADSFEKFKTDYETLKGMGIFKVIPQTFKYFDSVVKEFEVQRNKAKSLGIDLDSDLSALPKDKATELINRGGELLWTFSKIADDSSSDDEDELEAEKIKTELLQVLEGMKKYSSEDEPNNPTTNSQKGWMKFFIEKIKVFDNSSDNSSNVSAEEMKLLNLLGRVADNLHWLEMDEGKTPTELTSEDIFRFNEDLKELYKFVPEHPFDLSLPPLSKDMPRYRLISILTSDARAKIKNWKLRKQLEGLTT